MEAFDTVRTILAVRQYEDKPIPEVIVQQIIEAGRLTASAKNEQPWHFVVVQNKETLREIALLTQPYIAQASLAIVVGVDQTPYAISDASRAIQSMLLTAWSQGVGSNWVGFNNLNQVRPLLSIPEQIEVFAILPFGYPVASIGQGKKKRKSLDEVAHREKWSQPFA